MQDLFSVLLVLTINATTYAQWANGVVASLRANDRPIISRDLPHLRLENATENDIEKNPLLSNDRLLKNNT